MIHTENGTKLEEGTLLGNRQIRRSDKNADDGIVWVDKVAVIIKGAKVGEGAVLTASVRITKVRERFAFGEIV
jgi:hypothetical protein